MNQMVSQISDLLTTAVAEFDLPLGIMQDVKIGYNLRINIATVKISS